MDKEIQLTEHIKGLVDMHLFRNSLPENAKTFYDWYVFDRTKLNTYLTPEGICYYGRNALKQIP